MTATPSPEELVERLEAFVQNASAGVDFFDRIKDLPSDERTAVGTDHWDWIEQIARRAADIAPAAAALIRELVGQRKDLSEAMRPVKSVVHANIGHLDASYVTQDDGLRVGHLRALVRAMDGPAPPVEAK